jgi:hypothetical protein
METAQEFTLKFILASYAAAWAHHVVSWFAYGWWKGFRDKPFEDV